MASTRRSLPCSSSCFLKNPVVCFAHILLLVLVCLSSYNPFSFSSFLTLPILFLSTSSLLILYKTRSLQEYSSLVVMKLPQGRTQSSIETQFQAEVPYLKKGALGESDEHTDGSEEMYQNINGSKSQDVAEALEYCSDVTSSNDDDNSLPEASWFNDSSISDDESLIEIDLCDDDCFKQEESNKPGLPEFSPELLFRNHGLMELLGEISEEDSFIEIDITMGSIKCSHDACYQ